MGAGHAGTGTCPNLVNPGGSLESRSVRVEDAIVLAGGRSSRMGVDKAGLKLAGQTLVARAVAACAGCRSVVVAGGDSAVSRELPGAQVVREDPPFGGPVAGIAVGLAALPPAQPDDPAHHGDLVLVLACDLPNVAEIVATLRAANESEFSDGITLLDAQGWRQPLAAVYRRSSLESAVAALATPRGVSARRLISGMTLTDLPTRPGLTDDLDVPAEAQRYGIDGVAGDAG